MELNAAERLQLLDLARTTIATLLKDGRELEPPQAEFSQALSAKRGVFVTLHKHHDLRGCIGYIFPFLPLWQAVMENARNAAFRDPRFTPVRPEELELLKIEISVLTEPVVISDLAEFQVGRDGIILKKGTHQAVFLPQVAPEQGWDAATTLEHLSLKAGLGLHDWRTGASFETFQAEVFGEE